MRLGWLAVMVIGAACTGGERRGAQPDELRDDFGHVVDLTRRPTRIVSLNNTTTEVLFAIGAGDRVVGRTVWDVWPDSAKLVPAVGDAIRPNVEAVLGARPDLVLLYASEDNRPAVERLSAAGVATISFKIDSIAEFRRMALLLGRLVGLESRARAVVDSVDATLERVRTATAGRARPSVFFHTWERPLITIGGGSFLNELVTIAGGRNVYADLPSPAPVVTLEDVVRRDPDLVIVAPPTAERLRRTPGWQALRAVRDGRVLVYDTTAVGRPSVTMGMAAVNLASLIHPGAVRP